MATRPQCDAHADLAADLATAQERARQLERERDELAGAVLAIEGKLERLDQRLVGVKLTLARWGGIIAAIAALPLVVQGVQLLIRAAEAAAGR